MPAPVDASTTAGGGTRSGSSTMTTRCASGRYTHSHSCSCASRGLRERARALDKRLRLVDGLSRTDPLPCDVDLVPRVPQQITARPAVVVDVCDDALAVRLLPLLDGGKPRIEIAD